MESLLSTLSEWKTCVVLLGVVCVNCVAWLLSLHGGVSQWGVSGIEFEPGTLASIALCSAAFILAYLMVRSTKRILIWSIVVSVLIAFGVIHTIAYELHEPRLSTPATVHAMLLQFSNDPFSPYVGSGPNSLGSSWNKYRPQDINSSPQWNTDFNTSSSLALTLVVEFGVPFTIFLLLLICLEIFYACTIFSHSIRAALILSIIGLCAIFFFSPNIFFCAALSCALGALFAARHSHSSREGRSNEHARLLLSRGLAVSLCIILAFGIWRLGVRLLALSDIAQANSILTEPQPKFAEAEMLLQRSYSHEHLFTSAFMLASLYDSVLTSAVTKDHSQISAQEIRDIVSLASLFDAVSKEASALSSRNYHAVLLVGNAQVMQNILSGKQKNWDTITEYATAAWLAPSSPIPFFYQAQMLLAQGQKDEALLKLSRALELKPDYAPALQLLQKIQ